MSPRSRYVGPGRAPAEHADHRAGAAAGAHLHRQVGEGLQDGGLGPRQVQADLGLAVQPAAEVDGAVGVGAGGGEQVNGGGVCGHAASL